MRIRIVMLTEQDLQTKGLLQRTNIRTMRKDLQRLRELETLRETKKIVQFDHEETKTGEQIMSVIPPPQTSVPPKITIIPKETIEPKVVMTPKETTSSKPITPPATQEKEEKPSPQESRFESILQIRAAQEQKAIVNAKEYANESEKQKIFLLESQKKDLLKEIKAINDEQKPPLFLEKNRILLEQENLQKKLNPFIKEELEVETKRKNIEAIEQESNVPSERQVLEQQREALDDLKHKIDKQRWSTEEELAKLEANMKQVQEEYKKINTREEELTIKVADIDNALRSIYAAIVMREEKRRQELTEKQKLEIISKKDTLREKQLNPQAEEYPTIIKRDYMKDIPPAIKKQLQVPNKYEDEQRKKFMADVERWVNAKKQSEDTSSH